MIVPGACLPTKLTVWRATGPPPPPIPKIPQLPSLLLGAPPVNRPSGSQFGSAREDGAAKRIRPAATARPTSERKSIAALMLSRHGAALGPPPRNDRREATKLPPRQAFRPAATPSHASVSDPVLPFRNGYIPALMVRSVARERHVPNHGCVHRSHKPFNFSPVVTNSVLAAILRDGPRKSAAAELCSVDCRSRVNPRSVGALRIRFAKVSLGRWLRFGALLAPKKP